MTTKVTPIQLLRSVVFNKRPDPARLLPGQGAVNTNSAEPGLFFADDTGATLFKVGPCSVGFTAPNSGATGPVGALGNTLGELWFDAGTSTLRIWDGTTWLPCISSSSGTAIVAPTAPSLVTSADNSLWWSSTNGKMYILYNDGTTRQWTQISTNTVP